MLYQNIRKYMRLFLFTVLLTALTAQATLSAHPLSASFGDITIEDTKIVYTFSIDELSVLENIQADENSDHVLSLEEIDSVRPEMIDWIGQNIVLKVNDLPVRGSMQEMKLEQKGDKTVVTTKFHYPISASAETFSLQDEFYHNTADKTSYSQFLTVHQGDRVQEFILKGDDRSWNMSVGEGTGHSSWWTFFVFGMEHIITGYDHLLFLFALLLARQSFAGYVKVVTAFTVAHSITLTLGYLDMIVLPSRLVEAVIALSICYVALENIWRKEVNSRWMLTFGFGLVHGLGFAGLLSDMTIPKSHLVLSLLSFNLGIEVVQLALVALLLPVLTRVQKAEFYPNALKYGSICITLMGGYWLVERLFL